MEKLSKPFFEFDLNRAAYLVALGHKLYGLLRSDTKGRMAFIFDDFDGAVSRAILGFINNHPIPVRTFSDAVSNLKTQLHAQKWERDGK